MAEMLVDQYCNVISTPKESLKSANEIFNNQNAHGNNGIYDIYFSVDDLQEAISDISSTAAAWPDRFPAMLQKECKSAMSVPLHLIWRISLDAGQIAQILKYVHIVPIYKSAKAFDKVDFGKT